MKQEGFSLLEAVLVIMILSICSICISSHISYVEQIKFKILVNQVENGIKSAQYMASITGKEYNVFCTEKTVYILLDARKAVYIFDMGKNVIIPRNITGKFISFRGGMAPSRAGTVELVDSVLNHKARITIRVATGKTTVYFE